MKIYFAGAENPAHYKKLRNGGANNLLQSFYYMSKIDFFVEEIQKNQLDVFLDSGAHSFHVEKEQSQLAHYTDFFYRFQEFVAQYHMHYKLIAELDIETTVGTKLVYEWFDILREITDRVIPVWHVQRGIDKWKEYCEKYSYISIGKFHKMPKETVQKMVFYAYERGVKVHGFACTQPRYLEIVPFYSIDSTSWLMSEQYAYGGLMKNGNFLKYRIKDKKDVEKHVENSTFMTKDYAYRSSQMVKIFLDLEKHYTELWRRRGIVWKE